MTALRFENKKPHLNLGTIGHIDHGKTVLIAAITKVLALQERATFTPPRSIDNAPEEISQGIHLAITRVGCETENRSYHLIDCPGHRDCIKNLITGAVEIDGAILVVAADDGPMSQTQELLLLSQQVGLTHLIVFLNKCDLVTDPETLDAVEGKIRQLLSEHGFSEQEVPVIRGSARRALHSESENASAKEYAPIWALMEAADRYIPTPVQSIDKPFLMWVEDVCTHKDGSTVAIGQVERGTLACGSEVEVVGLNDNSQRAVVVHMETSEKKLDQAQAGDRVNLQLANIKKDEIQRGMVLAATGSISQHTRFKGEVYVLRREEGGRHKPFFSGYRPQFFMRTVDVSGTITLPAGVQTVMPGDNMGVEIELSTPVALEVGLRFAIREGGLTVGAGAITEILV